MNEFFTSLGELFSSIWTDMCGLTVPLLDISIAEFLIGIFAVKVIIDILRAILALSTKGNSNDKENK